MCLQMSQGDCHRRGQLISNILRAETPHEVLQIDSSAGHVAAKASYKRIALLLHPDKAKEQLACQAFQKAAGALQSLEGSSESYDRYKSANINILVKRVLYGKWLVYLRGLSLGRWTGGRTT